MKLNYVGALCFYGIMWMVIGVFLCMKGVRYSLEEVGLFTDQIVELSPILRKQIENRLLMILSIGMILGLIKGRVVLSRVVDRVIKKIVLFEEPISLKNLMDKRYLILIGGMMSLGILMRFLPITAGIKAIIDTAVGSALLYGSMLYFKKAYQFHKELPDL